MAGASGAEVRWGSVAESTVGTTPATPGFTVSSLDNVVFRATPNIREQKQNYANRRRSAISRSGFNVSGNGTGNLIYGEYDAILESLLQGTWSTNVLKDTTSGQTTFTYESTIPGGAGGTSTYFRYRGVEPVGGSLTLTADQDAAVEFNFIGTGSDEGTETAIAGATYTDPTNIAVLGSGSDVGFFTLGALTVPCMRSATINFNMESKDRQPRIGSDDLCGIRRGAAAPTLTGEFYIEDGFMEIYNACRTGSSFAVTIPLGSTTGEKYTIEFPAAEFVIADNEPSGEDLFQTFTILPTYDITEDCIVKITRAIA